jgi:hypothetical protein
MVKLKQGLKGQDKLKHSFVGNLIFLGTFLISFIATYKITLSLLIAFGVLLTAAVSKELYDKYVKKTFIDWYDILAAFVPYFIVKEINN